MPRTQIALVVLACLCFPGLAEARSHRVTQVPHGGNYGCLTCHETAAGGGVFTGFGSASVSALVGDGHVSTRDVDWAQLYAFDSDRDGFTNGEELGDPNGVWRIGDPDPPGLHYNPGDPDQHPPASCGDGRVTPPEECDGTNFASRTCITLGLEPGELICKSDCTFDRSDCGASENPAADAGTTPDGSAAPESDPGDDEGCATAPVAQRHTPALAWLLGALWWLRRRV